MTQDGPLRCRISRAARAYAHDGSPAAASVSDHYVLNKYTREVLNELRFYSNDILLEIEGKLYGLLVDIRK